MRVKSHACDRNFPDLVQMPLLYDPTVLRVSLPFQYPSVMANCMLLAACVAALSRLVSNIPGGFLRSRLLEFLFPAGELRRRHCIRSTSELKNLRITMKTD